MEPDARNSLCGVGGWRPSWLRGCATPRVFLVVYGLLGTIQAMAFVYFVSTLTTIEKRFKIPSRTTGIMLSGNEVSQILLSLFLTYYGGQRNRPLWIAWGVALSAASCFILASPHFVFGPGEEAYALTEEYLEHRHFNFTISQNEQAKLCSWKQMTGPDCYSVNDSLELSMLPAGLVFISQFVLGIGTTLYFTLGQTYMDDNSKKTKAPMLLGLTMALRTVGPAFGFLVGFACLSLYIDPSLTPVITKKDPRWLGAWWLGWILLGTTMLMFSLLIAMFPKYLPRKKKHEQAQQNIAVAVQQTPVLEKAKLGKEEYPLTTATSFNVEPLPVDAPIDGPKPPTLKEFPSALMRLLRNKLLMFNIWAGIFYILGGSAYITFITKYLEVQFHQSAAGASMVTAPISILAMMVGFLVSGFVISRWRPRSSYLLGWNVFVGGVYVLSEISFIFLGCPEVPLQGYRLDGFGRLDLTTECNANCGCNNIKYDPVCYEPLGLTFYSACHAGCNSSFVINEAKIYDHCGCVAQAASGQYQGGWQGPGHGSGDANHHHQYYSVSGNQQGWSASPQGWSASPQGWTGSSQDRGYSPYSASPWPQQSGYSVKAGPCQLDCQSTFLTFIIITTIMHTLGSSGKVGNLLVNYRAVDPKEKAFAQGLSLFLISLFAFIPGPIFFGAIIDSTCLVWEESCGHRGNCWHYDPKSFRLYLNGAAAAITSIGVILDAVVCYLGRNLQLYDDETALAEAPQTETSEDPRTDRPDTRTEKFSQISV